MLPPLEGSQAVGFTNREAVFERYEYAKAICEKRNAELQKKAEEEQACQKSS